MKTIIVTGGAGFIGSHVVDALIRRGFQVHVIDDLSAGFREQVGPEAVLHVMDIRSPEIAELMKGIGPDAVVHMAAQIDLPGSVEDPVSDADINIIGGLNVLKASREAGTRHFTFASSAAVYGGQERFPIAEDATLRPSSPYGAAKLSFEHYVDVYRSLHGMPAATLRFANVYGPRQRTVGEAGVVAIFADRIRNGVPPTVFGDGTQTRDYVYVGDVAEAVASAAADKVSGTYNISTGVEISVSDLLEMMMRIAGKDIEPAHEPERPGDERRSSLDPSRAESGIGWTAKIPLEDGLSRTFAWLS